MENPFYITGTIPERFFFDRAKETEKMVQILTNKAHILLTSPRRMGKTQLINHVYAQADLSEKYNTFYTDIFPTSSLHEFVLFLSKEIYSKLVPQRKSVLDHFIASLKSLSGSFGYNPLTGTPTFNIRLGDIHSPELTLEEICAYLESAEKPCIFAIDEFQQVSNYPEKNVEALLRSYIQSMNNCCFIYAGSNRHILENMFHSPAKPFYNSAEQMYLDKIPEDIYVSHSLELIKECGREAEEDAVRLAYRLFDGHTYYVHNLLHNAFADIKPSETIDTGSIYKTLDTILDDKAKSFASIINQLNYPQKETLVAIAKEGKATSVTSTQFMKRHSLTSPSSVQYSITKLLDAQLISFENFGRTKTYCIADKFLEKWIARTY